MKRYFLFIIACNILSVACSQSNKALDNNITLKNTQRIIGVLAADDMKGRKTYSPEIEKAARFIANEFKKIGLKPLNKNGGYLQKFSRFGAVQKNVSAMVNGTQIDSTKVFVFTSQADFKIDQTSGYAIETLNAGDNLGTKITRAKTNTIIFANDSMKKMLSYLARVKQSFVPSDNSVVLILTNDIPTSFSIYATNIITEKHLENVVGILPGKSKKDEFVIFSGHYDHLGIKSGAVGDSIFNGANDDAAGTTAVIQLAKYYRSQHNNERTIVFAAFTAEEIGGFGSQYFSKQFDPQKVVAMFNIEMIGTDSKWGNNSAYITGYEKTNMGEILQKSLTGTGFTFYPDPYTTQNLFYRSDNATLARLGVPAHTISTSKMDAEPNYHKVSDEISTLDLDNMTRIIKAIALSATSIINGKETPSRVNTSELK